MSILNRLWLALSHVLCRKGPCKVSAARLEDKHTLPRIGQTCYAPFFCQIKRALFL